MSMDGLAIEGSQDGNRYVYHFHCTNSNSYFHSNSYSRGYYSTRSNRSSHSTCPCAPVARHHVGLRFRCVVE